MNYKKVMAAAMAVTLVGGGVIGCSKKDDAGATNSPSPAGSAAPSSAPTKSGKPQQLTINYSAEPPVLDVSKATAAAAFTMINAVSEGLYRLDKDGKPQPGLAKDMPVISSDGLTYTITLRDGLTWSDGQPLKASDFVYSFKRTLDPATKADYNFMVGWIKGGNDVINAKTPDEVAAKEKAVGVEAKDDKTLVITLDQPKAFFTQQLAFASFFPQREDIVTKAGEKNGADVDTVIGAGPFKLTKWEHDQTLEFSKNDKYWDAANVKLDKFTVNVVKDKNTGLNLFETNAADVTEISGDQLKLYDGKPEKVLKPELTNTYFEFNQAKDAWLKNANIRKALTLSVDRKAFVDTVINNGSVPSTGFVPTGTADGNKGDFRKSAGDTEPAFDAAKAKQYLADGLKELGMTALPKFKILGDDTETAKKSLEFIQAQWKQNLGIDADPDPVPHKLRLENQAHVKDFDVVVTLWGADYNDPMTFMDMYVTGGTFNYGGYSNPKLDEPVKAAEKETDPAKRAALLVTAEKALMDDMGVGPLYFRSRVFVQKTNISGLIMPSFGPEFELKWASVK